MNITAQAVDCVAVVYFGDLSLCVAVVEDCLPNSVVALNLAPLDEMTCVLHPLPPF